MISEKTIDKVLELLDKHVNKLEPYHRSNFICLRHDIVLLKKPKSKKPKVGDKIYVPTRMYIDHGEDDVQGGLATISRVSIGMSAGQPTYFIEVKELSHSGFNYEMLLEDQEKMKKEYGKQKAHPDPDYG